MTTRFGRLATFVIAGLLVAGGGAACSEEDTGSGSGGDNAADNGGASANRGDEAGGNRATDDYTPHVGPRQPVVVDTLTWRVRAARTAATVGSEFINETANGIFVIVDVSVRNGKDESVTLSSDQITLVAGGKEYEGDTAAQLSLTAADGGEALLFEELGPDLTQDGTTVFDVPQAALKNKPEICFGELGFGPGRGCIALKI